MTRPYGVFIKPVRSIADGNLSAKQIAEAVGCDASRVRQIAKEYSLPLRPVCVPASPAERFQRFFDETDGCWEWTGGLFSNGYGKFNSGEKTVYAHRFAWERHKGSIPSGLNVCHRCDNRLCVRPDHLFIGTQKDNVADMMRKGRARRGCLKGSAIGNSILTEGQVALMRSKYRHDRRGDGVKAAVEFGVHTTTVSKILRGEAWSHL